MDDANSLKRELVYSDQQKFSEYFDSLRAIKKQINRLEKMKSELPPPLLMIRSSVH